MRQRAEVSGRVVGVGNGSDDARRILKDGRVGHDSINGGVEAQPLLASPLAEEEASPLMAKAAAQKRKRRPPKRRPRKRYN
jgi:hypothetical protein